MSDKLTCGCSWLYEYVSLGRVRHTITVHPVMDELREQEPGLVPDVISCEALILSTWKLNENNYMI